MPNTGELLLVRMIKLLDRQEDLEKELNWVRQELTEWARQSDSPLLVKMGTRLIHAEMTEEGDLEVADLSVAQVTEVLDNEEGEVSDESPVDYLGAE